MHKTLEPTEDVLIDVDLRHSFDRTPSAHIFTSGVLVGLVRGDEELDPLDYEAGTVSLYYTATQLRAMARDLLMAADLLEPPVMPRTE